MIQEIYPHRLRNEFVPGRIPRSEDIVICVKDNTIMVGEGRVSHLVQEHENNCSRCGQMLGRGGRRSGTTSTDDDNADGCISGNYCGYERGGTLAAIRFPLYMEMPENMEYRYLFSLDDRGVYYAVDEGMEPLTGFQYMTLREIRWKIGKPLHFMYLAYTVWHLICWYRDNRYCGRCGHATHHSDRERALVCDNCGNTIYPRIVPAVIVGVTWGDKLLMTKYANRDVPFYALVAGFTEIGETMEECVAREVMEETGLKVKNIRYYKSQPWGSVQDILMGFYCDVDGDTTIRIDRSELKEGLWVERGDIQGQPDDLSLTHHMMIAFKEGKEPRFLE